MPSVGECGDTMAMRDSEERREHTHIRGVPVCVIMPPDVDLLISFHLGHL